jgi:hypothetical protein
MIQNLIARVAKVKEPGEVRREQGSNLRRDLPRRSIGIHVSHYFTQFQFKKKLFDANFPFYKKLELVS